MKIKRMTERLGSGLAKQTAKRVLALALAVLMLNPGAGYGLAAYAQETLPAVTQEVKNIQAFAPLPAEIASQQLAAGAPATDIKLPTTLAVTVAVLPAAAATTPAATSAPEAISTPAVTADPAVTSAPAADSTAPATAETTQAVTLENVSWAIDPASSTYSTFTPGEGSARYTYLPTLPAGYTVAGGVTLPQITVQVNGASATVSMARMEDAPAACDGWEAATAGGVTPSAGDIITVNGVAATYQRDISTSGLQTTNSDFKMDGSSVIYKAGTGYVLLTWPTAPGLIQLTMHDATIDTGAATTNGISIFGPVNVTLEGNNSITTIGIGLQSNNSMPTLAIGGSGTLMVNAGVYALDTYYHGDKADQLTILGSVNLTLCGQVGMHGGDIAVKGSSTVDITATQYAVISNHSLAVADTAKLTAKGEAPFIIAFDTIGVGSEATLNGIREEGHSYSIYNTVSVLSGTILNLSDAASITAQPGARIINGGTLNLPAGYTYSDIAALAITGDGILQVGGKAVTIVNGGLYAVGTVSGGLDLKTPPPEPTYYKAGGGYILFIPAISDTPATLVLHNAQISSSAFQALSLGAKTVIRLEGANSIENTAVDTHCVGIMAYSTSGVPQPIAITGGSGDSLLVSAWQCTYGIGNLTVSGASVTMSSTCYGLLTEGDVLLENGAKLSVKGGEGGDALQIGNDMGSPMKPYGLTLSGGSTLTVEGSAVISGNLAVGKGSKVTIREEDRFWMVKATSITNEGTITGGGTFVLPNNYTAAQVQALKIFGTVKLFDTLTGKYKIYVDGEFYADGGTLKSSLNLTVPPKEETCYKLNSGDHVCYIIFTPAKSGENAVLTLHDVNNSGYLMSGIILPDAPLTLRLVGKNYIWNITASNDLTVSGDGLLGGKIVNTNGTAVVAVDSGATLNAMYQTKTGETTVYKIYGKYFGGMQIDPDEKLILTPGSTLRLMNTNVLIFSEHTSFDHLALGEGATIDNDNVVVLPQGTTPAQIAALPLTGIGVVVVPTSYDTEGNAKTWNTYTNEGIAVKTVGNVGGLDLTAGDYSGKTVQNDGYAWDSSTQTLTLGNAFFIDTITLPATATVVTVGPTVIRGQIEGQPGVPLDLVFSGTAPLNIIRGISGGVNGDTVTVQGGAQVSIGQSVFLGASGAAGGTLNVVGAGTRLIVSADFGYAVMCDTVNLQDGAALTANGDIFGVEALTGVNVTGGSVLTTNCDYGVYIKGGKLTVDDTSKLVTNGAIAPFCIVDASSQKTQSEVLALPGVPDGTQVAVATGELGKYWSLAPVNGSLSVSKENSTPVILAGAKTGALSFVKVSTGDSGSTPPNSTPGASSTPGTGNNGGTPVVSTGSTGSKKVSGVRRGTSSSAASKPSSSKAGSASSSHVQPQEADQASSSKTDTTQNSEVTNVEKQLSTSWIIFIIIILCVAVTVGYLVYRRKKRS